MILGRAGMNYGETVCTILVHVFHCTDLVSKQQLCHDPKSLGAVVSLTQQSFRSAAPDDERRKTLIITSH